MSPVDEMILMENIEAMLHKEINRLYMVNGKRPNVLIMNEYTYIILKEALRGRGIDDRWRDIAEYYGMTIVRLEPKQMIDGLSLWFTFGSTSTSL